jgi:hypothetical protein
MPLIKVVWMPASKATFDALKKKAIEAGKYQELMTAHNEILSALRDSDSAFEKGELLFKTRKASGEVRLYVNRCISICYVVFHDENAGWILKYNAVPDEWPA